MIKYFREDMSTHIVFTIRLGLGRKKNKNESLAAKSVKAEGHLPRGLPFKRMFYLTNHQVLVRECWVSVILNFKECSSRPTHIKHYEMTFVVN